MASRWLSRGDSEVSDDISTANEEKQKSEEDAHAMLLRRVVARSSVIWSSKRVWLKPPSEVANPRKPAKPRVAEQIGLSALVVAVAVATACATALGGAVATACATALGGPAPSTPDPANPVVRVSAAGEKPPRVDVAVHGVPLAL